MEATMPTTARDALTMWDAGEALQAFQVETTPERQIIIYGVAFEIIRRGESAIPFEGELSQREIDVAKSIALVATDSGWAKMVSQHIHRDSPAITIRKPKD